MEQTPPIFAVSHATSSLNLDRAGTAGQASGRTSATDFDGDGCSDMDELHKPEPGGKCGDDPYNPWDFDDQFIGGISDGAIVVGDIGAVVAQFGHVGCKGK